MEVAMSLPIELPKQRNDYGMCFANSFSCSLNARDRKIVCVTSGNSYFGSHLIKKLLVCGYLVRVTIQNQANLEDMKELMREEMEQLESVVVAKMGDLESLCSAFRGCHAIFHTSSFIDPHGISGYTERMAFLETEAAKNVIEACGRAAYIKRCIFTSSLLACIWKGNDLPNLIDESSWSDEAFCRENKLWLALAKTRAEKAAWNKAREMKVKLVSLCPGLLMAPSFPNAHLETSIPYLKGGHFMLRQGLLATEDVSKVAEAHIYVYEDMDYGACGRYICFGKIIGTLEKAIQLENGLNMHGQLSGNQNLLAVEVDNDEIHPRTRITKSKLSRLIFRSSQRRSCKQ
ncbi:cinnamoyl-CoA reductase-like SNL6 [Nicotiana tabacum]|uniref:Cinnamoyl-CoA reductase-like SNL6 n=1 Tax=Nicotiana tabacum TaxID=4097 RepID=A0A1S3ZCP1_TOBAC|nr:PREDICTED: dihydroflavonol-4-reductase-like [Nicotiana tabacum]